MRDDAGWAVAAGGWIVRIDLRVAIDSSLRHLGGCTCRSIILYFFFLS